MTYVWIISCIDIGIRLCNAHNMNDDTDNKVDYLNSPDMGSISGSAIEGFEAPVIERPASGGGKTIAKPQPAVASEDNSAALRSVRTDLAAENTSVRTAQVAGIPVEIPKVPLDVNQENRENINRMMEDNLEAERRKQQGTVVRESPIATAVRITGSIVSSLFQR